ncbi:MAG: serpin family protein [Clostridiales bacterium]|nr:serpin family protein [Clostridiales bacterium]
MKKLVAVLLMTSMLLTVPAGCSKTGKVLDVNNVAGITEKRDNGKEAIFQLAKAQSGKSSMTQEELDKAYSEFIFELMKRCAKESDGENVLVSADSVLFALEMVAAGADGETLDQLMNTLVPGADNVTAFHYAVDRMNSLQNDSLKIANSVWINQEKTDHVYDDYLQYVQRHFDARVGVVPFDDSGVDTINNWVSEHTEKRIKTLLKRLPEYGLMVLVNAIAFDGKWKVDYTDMQVHPNVFTNGEGEPQTVDFLCGSERVYLDNGNATGFLKEYDDGKYAFMTILPNDESIDINEFIADMTPAEYWAFWESQDDSLEVLTFMPQFKSEYEIQLPDILQDMGITDAFDAGKADFSNLCKTPVFISEVIHKTYIDVNKDGTQAAAATAVSMREAASLSITTERIVSCDRPFAYAIVDLDTGLPVFLGTVEKV